MFVIDVYDRVSEEHTRITIGCADVAEEMYDVLDAVCDTMMGMSVDIYEGDIPDRDGAEMVRLARWLAEYESREVH